MGVGEALKEGTVLAQPDVGALHSIFGQLASTTIFLHVRIFLSCTLLVLLRKMASVEIAEEIRSIFPGTEELIVQYLSGYLVDDAGEEEDVLQVANDILDSLGMNHPDDVKRLMARLRDLLAEQLSARARNSGRPKLMKLDKVMDMSKVGAMSNTIGLGEGVDLESINKGK